MHVRRGFLGWGVFLILAGAIPLAVRAGYSRPTSSAACGPVAADPGRDRGRAHPVADALRFRRRAHRGGDRSASWSAACSAAGSAALSAGACGSTSGTTRVPGTRRDARRGRGVDRSPARLRRPDRSRAAQGTAWRARGHATRRAPGRPSTPSDPRSRIRSRDRRDGRSGLRRRETRGGVTLPPRRRLGLDRPAQRRAGDRRPWRGEPRAPSSSS